MGIVELVIALVGPTLEFVVPLVFYLFEAMVWVVLLIVSLLKSLFFRSKPQLPNRVIFSGLREKNINQLQNWRSYKEKRKQKNENT